MAKPIYGDLELKGQQTLRFADSDSSNVVSLGAPATVSSDLALVLPSADTTSGAMVSDGSGNLSLSLIANANIDASAAIAQSKLSLSITNAEVNASAAIAYSKLNLTGEILNADINASAAIAQSKLALDITNSEVNASAAIAESKLALDQSTADLAQRDLDNLTVASLAAESLLVGSSATAVSALGVGTNGQVLKVVAGSIAWAADTGSNSFQDTWTTAQTATKAITHNLGTKDVIVQVYDQATDQTIEIDSVVRTDTNTVTVTASEAPNASSWRVLIMDAS